MKKVCVNFLLVLISLSVGYLVAELIIRAVLLDKYLFKGWFRVSQYKDIVYEYKPSITYNSKPYEDLKINSSGFRDYEFNKSKEPEKIKIICLGDSATFGHGISKTENTLPKQLETLLNKDEKGKYQVYNMGVQAYNTHHELGVLKHKALEYKPDVVILVFNFGDIGYDWLTVKHGQVVTALNFPPVMGKNLPENINDFLLQNSATYFFTELLLSKHLNSKEIWRDHTQSKVTKLTDFNNNFGYDISLLKDFDIICKKNKIRFIIAIMPWFQFPVYKQSPEMQLLNKLEVELTKNNIEYIDLFKPVLYENNKTSLSPEQYTMSLKVNPNDNHPNEIAVNKYAEAIEQYLVENNKL